MKKIYSLLIVIMTLSLFFILFDIYSERELSDAHNLYGLDDWEATSNIQFNSNIADIDDEVYIRKLEELAEKHNVIIISEKFERDDKGKEDFIFYVYPDTDMEVLFNLNVTKNKSKNEAKNSEKGLFYSTDDSLNPDYHIDLINPKLSVTIYPFSYLQQDPSQKYRSIEIISDSKKSVSDFNADVLEEFSFASPDINQMHSHSFDYDSAFRQQIQVFFILSMILLALFMIFNISDEMKRIAIEKMQGFTNGRIAFSLFYPIVLHVIFCQAITTLFTFILFIRQWNKTVIHFMQEYLLAIAVIDIVFIVILILVYTIVSFLKLPKLIKDYNFNNMLLNITFFIKIIFLVLLIPMFLNGIKTLTILIPDYLEIIKVEQNYSGILDIIVDTIETRFDGYDIGKYSSGIIDEVYEHHANIYDQLAKTNNLIYQERSTVLLNKSAKKNEKKEITVGMGDVSQKLYRGFNVDGNYLRRNPIIGQDGEIIDLDLSGDIVYILLPKSIYEKNYDIESSFYTDGNPMEVIIIQDGQKFIDYSFITFGPLKMERHQETPFFRVYSDNSFRYNKSIMINCYLTGFKDMDEAKVELKKIDPKKDYILISAEERIGVMKVRIREDILKSFISLLPATGVIIAMNFSVLGLYYRSKRKKLSILKINGYSTFVANADLLVELFLSFAVPAVVLYYLYSKDIFLALGYALLIDIICGGVILMYYRRMKVAL